MQIKQLEYFLTVAECQSFKKAADQLFISRQALSQSIITLEEELSFPLFVRLKQGVILTLEGEQFVKYAEKMIDYYRKCLNISHELSSSVSQNFHLVVPPFFGHHLTFLSDVLSESRKRYPHITFHMHETKDLSFYDEVKQYHANAFLVMKNCETELSQQTLTFANEFNYAYKKIAKIPFSIVVNKNNSLSAQDSITLAQLSTLALAIKESSLFQKYHSYFSAQTPPYYVSHPNEALYLVSNHIELATIDSPIMQFGTFFPISDNLVFLPLQNHPLYVDCYLFHRQCNLCSEVELTIINMIANSFSSLAAHLPLL